MIIKSKPRKNASFRQLLEYLVSDKGRGQNQPRFTLTQHVRGNSVDEWTQSFLENQDKHGKVRKNGTKVLHEIISFHVRDKRWIDQEKLKDITQQYLKLRSEKGLFVAIPHIEDEHQHVHICGSPWEFGGQKTLRLSQKEFKTLKLEIEQYQWEKYPELVHSIVEHDSHRVLARDERQGHARIERVREVLVDTLSMSTATTEFFDKLKKAGLEVYKRKGVACGVVYEERKYRFKRFGISREVLTNLELYQTRLRRDTTPNQSQGRDVGRGYTRL